MKCTQALVFALVLVAASSSEAALGSGRGSSWSEARAEARGLHAPPPSWTKRGWTVAAAVCDGLGPPTAPAKPKGSPAGKRARLYPNFSCEITVVHPTRLCPSLGNYVCVAGWESTAKERTLHVLDETRYALYRVPS